MNIYLTTGSYEFLSSKKAKFPNENLVLMHNNDHSLLLHESSGKTIFQTARSYEVVDSMGTLENEGFVAMNYIPISEEGRPLFEHHFKSQLPFIEKEPGFMSIRILSPKKSDTYLILTLWDNELSFKNWQKTKTYLEVIENNIGIIDSSHLFTTGNYVSTYYLQNKEKK
jgi:heme oxygenase (mycobilin-producing)